jgi:cell division protein YceG involved in septum cleavage
MDKKLLWIIFIILVLILFANIIGFYKYTYHERDESYVNLNGVYIKCISVEEKWNKAVINCSIPNGTLQIVKSTNFVSTIK